MRHITIDYGIDLGTTNSAICRMRQGMTEIIRSDNGMETMPSCVSFKKGGVIRIGQSAYDDLEKDKLRALKKKSALASSSCIEFKRYMGSDFTFSNINVEHLWTPEELSAKVVKTLCSFVTDDEVKAAVITVPAKFTVNQKIATLEAARLAGIEQVELLQEPIAASMAYGLKAEEKNGNWMVFDFGGGTLDVALVNVNDGVMQVFDTEGDNYLGGKNIDEAIVSGIILPQISSRFALNLSDKEQYALLMDALKVEAEKIKNKLSYCESETLYLEAGDWGEDEDGEEIEMEITITRENLEKAIKPILQKAVDVCKSLMMRNHISFGQLTHLILIGGPTYIPLLRQMLKEQVTENVETGINPMTAVATGAAIYASTIPMKTSDVNPEEDTLQLLVDFDATTVDTNVLVPVRMKTPINGLCVKMIRRSDNWESTNVTIDNKGGLVELELIPNQPNTFRLAAYVNGVPTRCFPSEITLLQGTKAGSAILPYNIGLEVFNPKRKRSVFTALTGLEKNRPLPAVGTVYGLKTLSDLRPGMETDVVRIAIYQGDDNAEGKTAALFEYVSDVKVGGDDIVSYIPKGSIVNIKIDVDRSEMMTITAEFPQSAQTVEKHLDTSHKQASKDSEYLSSQILYAYGQINQLANEQEDNDDIDNLRRQVRDIEDAFNAGAQHKQTEQHLKEVLRTIEDYEQSTEWNRIYRKLQKAMMNLQIEAMKYKDDTNVNNVVDSFNIQVERLAKSQDIAKAKALQSSIEDYEYTLARDEIYRDFILSVKNDFCYYKWENPKLAQKLIEQAMEILKNNPNAPYSETKDVAEYINSLIIRQRVSSGSSEKSSSSVYNPIDLPSM